MLWVWNGSSDDCHAWRRDHTRLNLWTELRRSTESLVRTHFWGLLDLIQSISSSWIVSESSKLLNICFVCPAYWIWNCVLFIIFFPIDVFNCIWFYKICVWFGEKTPFLSFVSLSLFIAAIKDRRTTKEYVI